MNKRHFTLFRAIAAGAALALLAPLALADVPVTYRDAGRALFSFDAPDFWTVRSGGSRELTAPGSHEARQINRVIGLQPSTESRVWVGFMSPQGVRNFDQALFCLAEIGPFLVKDPPEGARHAPNTPSRALLWPAHQFTGPARAPGFNMTVDRPLAWGRSLGKEIA